MKTVRIIAAVFSAIELALWHCVFGGVEHVFRNFKGFDRPARWLFALMLAPLLVALAVLAAPFYAACSAHPDREHHA